MLCVFTYSDNCQIIRQRMSNNLTMDSRYCVLLSANESLLNLSLGAMYALE